MSARPLLLVIVIAVALGALWGAARLGAHLAESRGEAVADVYREAAETALAEADRLRELRAQDHAALDAYADTSAAQAALVAALRADVADARRAEAAAWARAGAAEAVADASRAVFVASVGQPDSVRLPLCEAALADCQERAWAAEDLADTLAVSIDTLERLVGRQDDALGVFQRRTIRLGFALANAEGEARALRLAEGSRADQASALQGAVDRLQTETTLLKVGAALAVLVAAYQTIR